MESPSSQLRESPEISTLKSKLAALEQEENFGEAYQALRSINHMIQQSKVHKLRRLSTSQQERSQAVENNYKSTISQHNASWSEAIQKFSETCQEERNALLSQNRAKLEKLWHSLDEELPPGPKPSMALLHLIKCKEKAVRSKQYQEAEWLVESIKREKRKEAQAYQEQRNFKIKAAVTKLSKTLDYQVARLEARQKAAMNELLIQKNLESKRLDQKYNNIRKSLNTAQNIETNKVSGRHTTVAGRHSEFDKVIDLCLQSSMSKRRSQHPRSPVRRYLNISI